MELIAAISVITITLPIVSLIMMLYLAELVKLWSGIEDDDNLDIALNVMLTLPFIGFCTFFISLFIYAVYGIIKAYF